jgi:hypothetical protein
MHKMIVRGTIASCLTLAATGAFAFGGGNLSPEESPYAILEPQTVMPDTTFEGRSAFTGGDAGDLSGVRDAPPHRMTRKHRKHLLRDR